MILKSCRSVSGIQYHYKINVNVLQKNLKSNAWNFKSFMTRKEDIKEDMMPLFSNEKSDDWIWFMGNILSGWMTANISIIQQF